MSDPISQPRIDYEIDQTRKRVRAVFNGAVTADMIEEYMRAVTEDPRYQRDYDAIIDLRSFSAALSQEDLQRLAMFVRQHPGDPGARRAVIVPNRDVLAMSRVFEALTVLTPVVYRSFSNEETVEAWLAERHCGRPEGNPGPTGE